MLTPRYLALLVYINRQLKETGRSPSFVEMKDAVKARSMSSVYRAISALEKQGFISRRRGRLREIEVVRLPEDRHNMPAAIGGDLVAHLFPPSDALTVEKVPADELPRNDRTEADLPMETPREAGERGTMPASHGSDGPPSSQALQMITDLAVVTRARELVGDVVWTKLSVRTQANILRSELNAMDFELSVRPAASGSAYYDARAGLSASLTARLFPASMAHAADAVPAAEPQRDGWMEANPPAETSRDAGEGATTAGTQRPDTLPSLQALQMATEAVRRGYGLTEATRDPEIVAQAIELSFLLVAYGLFPTTPATAMARPDTASELRQEPRTAKTIGRLTRASPHILVVDDVSDVLVSVTAFLVGAGFVVATAADGDAALRLIASDPLIGVLVTDFVMPGMSGVDLIVQAVQLRPDLKALLITGYPNADGLADLPPEVAVLAKPFRRAALIERVSVLAAETRPVQSEEVTELVHVND